MENVLGSIRSSLESSDSSSGGVSGNLSFGQVFHVVKHVAVAPCNSDVVTANISKHQLTSPSGNCLTV